MSEHRQPGIFQPPFPVYKVLKVSKDTALAREIPARKEVVAVRPC